MPTKQITVNMQPKSLELFPADEAGVKLSFDMIDAITARNRLTKAIDAEQGPVADALSHGNNASQLSAGATAWRAKYMNVLQQVWQQWARTVGSQAADVETSKLAVDFAHFVKHHDL